MSMILIGVALLAIGIALTLFGRWGQNWGATQKEIGMPLGVDAWLDGDAKVKLRMTRGIWIDAPREHVWPWVAQVGRGAGWYSYDRLDNGGRRSARHLVTWIPEPRLGDAGPIGYLRHLEPGRELAWWLGGAEFFGAHVRNIMFFRVEGDGPRTRLLVRMSCDARGPFAAFACWLYRILDSIMARKQMLGIKQRAEDYRVRTEDDEYPEIGERDQYQLYQGILASGEIIGDTSRKDAEIWRRAAIEDGLVQE